MRIRRTSPLLAATVAVLVAAFAWGTGPGAADPGTLRKQAQQAMRNGNFRDAYEGLRKLALDPANDPALVGTDLQNAIACLRRLNRIHEADQLIERAVEVHAGNWRLLWAAAKLYSGLPHQGFIIGGEFRRGPHRGGGQMVTCTERDRVRALQLMQQAIPLALKDEAGRREAGGFFLDLARMLLGNRGYREAWRLQSLTDLNTLPDYQPGWSPYRSPQGAPVDEQGNPVFHRLPKSWEAATTDGQRWRWALAQAAECDSQLLNQTRSERARFLHQQFGVQTLSHYGWRFGRMATDDTKDTTTGTFALHTLGENETIARLATGVRRFTLPDEFNFIKIFQQVADSDRGSVGRRAIQTLAQIFENRRQYPKAADYWRRLLREHPHEHNDNAREHLRQIEGNWGRFEPVLTQPVGKGATVEFRFRNGHQVEFTAHEILIDKLLRDVKEYIKSRPTRLDGARLNVGNLGYRLVTKNQKQYLGRQVARWQLALDPRKNHFDRRITVTTPLQRAGAYLLTATMADGNTCHIVVWLADTVIIKKPMGRKNWWMVADAVTGEPIPGANVEFFGFRQEHKGRGRFEIYVKDFAQYTDEQGQVTVDIRQVPNDYQWLAIARTGQGRLAYLGFTSLWYTSYDESPYNQIKVFTITDRPVYRPGQTVHYKFWVRRAQYDKDETSQFAGRTFTVEIYNAKGQRVVERQEKADAYGGLAGELELPDDAPLGVWRLQVRGHGGGSFRVEEYKKPEFEVSVEAPQEPVMLGEPIEATIKATYYFGSPVTRAKVRYKVLRTSQTARWYPPAPWDWFYGPGYWWFAYDYRWYPGWERWGCVRPMPFWWPQSYEPPEVVAEQEVEIGPDGTVKVAIDTALAKALHSDTDHRYEITAEVTDQSRRTIVGTGSVLVARQPFKVHVWVDRGYYHVGDTVVVHCAARRLDGKPVTGHGQLTLYSIRYRDGKPVERAVHEAPMTTNAEGMATAKIRASAPGQYRISCRIKDAKGHEIEGGYVFTAMGTGVAAAEQFRFNDLELVPDRRQYRPGDKVQLQINTNRPQSTVLLFVRPCNGVYLPPRLLHLEGKSTVVSITVRRRDMPNFFVEAVTVADGRVHTEAKEIAVPPEKRILSVEVKPSRHEYRPGEKAQVRLRLTDLHGNPFTGSAVVAIYDKALEYISGGSNVPEIKAFFWKWRRRHFPGTQSSLDRQGYNIVPPGKRPMRDIGVFGASVPEESEEFQSAPHGGMGGAPGFAAPPTNGRRMAKAMSQVAEAAMPEAAPVAADRAFAESDALAAKPAPAASSAVVQPVVRQKFADTALWVGSLETDSNGVAEVDLTMPENLTTWRIKTWAMGHGTKVGQGETDVVTRKNLIIRLQAPRFFIQTDEVVLSANVHNYLQSPKQVQVVLELEGDVLECSSSATQTVRIDANGEARVDWRVRVRDEGRAVVRMKALTDEESDAMQMSFPCYVHGMLKMDSYCGSIRPDDDRAEFRIRVPAERRVPQTRLEVRWSPTLAGAMVDALPYLVNYPYGCTEQTLNRFLPTVITQKILIEMGLDLEAIRKKQVNLNPQELGDAAKRAAGWKRYDRNPVFDVDQVQRMVTEGVQALTEMQLSDGGWGWFSGWGEHSTAHMTAYVVHGLQIARENDVAVVPDVLQRGIEWLKRHQSEQLRRLRNGQKDPKVKPWKLYADNTDAFVYMVLVDAGAGGEEMQEMMRCLYRDRTHLSVYGLAMFGLGLEKQQQRGMLDMVLRNINQYVEQDDENQTAWLNLPGGYWWCWYGSEFEAHAYYLKLLARTDPHGELARRLVKYLLNNRKHATYWKSTRDTALCIEALAEYLRASGENKPEMTVEVYVDGRLRKAVEITAENLFAFDNSLVLTGEELAAGEHTVQLRKRGRGPLYFNGYLTNFTLEDYITRAGLEIKVDRRYYRLRRVKKSVEVAGSRGQVIDQRVEKYEREPLENLAMLRSGELVEIELVIESKNDYEYLVFEDMKPAGFEPVDLRSGYNGNALGAYVEFRDNRVVFFVSRLARGRHSVSYRMRAEIPGRFSALPTRASAMYAPELKANSDEIKLRIED